MTKNNNHINYNFSQKKVDFFFRTDLVVWSNSLSENRVIWMVDENVHNLHQSKFTGKEVIIVPSGEQHKQQETVNKLVKQLIENRVDRTCFIVGVGGGVTTDIVGFVASTFMRGLRFGLVPTTILAMVDASIGGKNGIDVGIYKNMVGVVNHPEWLVYDFSFLSTLPDVEWRSGFAEIIKHACIKDAALATLLESENLQHFQSDEQLISDLVLKNVGIKSKVVISDERENGERRLLNFGHTFGHAIENVYKIPHGFAVSIGMVIACRISQQLNGLPEEETKRVTGLLQKYSLPVAMDIDKKKVWEVMKHDKKLAGDDIHLITLKTIGKGEVMKIPLAYLEKLFFYL